MAAEGDWLNLLASVQKDAGTVLGEVGEVVDRVFEQVSDGLTLGKQNISVDDEYPPLPSGGVSVYEDFLQNYHAALKTENNFAPRSNENSSVRAGLELLRKIAKSAYASASRDTDGKNLVDPIILLRSLIDASEKEANDAELLKLSKNLYKSLIKLYAVKELQRALTNEESASINKLNTVKDLEREFVKFYTWIEFGISTDAFWNKLKKDEEEKYQIFFYKIIKISNAMKQASKASDPNRQLAIFWRRSSLNDVDEYNGFLDDAPPQLGEICPKISDESRDKLVAFWQGFTGFVTLLVENEDEEEISEERHKNTKDEAGESKKALEVKKEKEEEERRKEEEREKAEEKRRKEEEKRRKEEEERHKKEEERKKAEEEKRRKEEEKRRKEEEEKRRKEEEKRRKEEEEKRRKEEEKRRKEKEERRKKEEEREKAEEKCRKEEEKRRKEEEERHKKEEELKKAEEPVQEVFKDSDSEIEEEKSCFDELKANFALRVLANGLLIGAGTLLVAAGVLLAVGHFASIFPTFGLSLTGTVPVAMAVSAAVGTGSGLIAAGSYGLYTLFGDSSQKGKGGSRSSRKNSDERYVTAEGCLQGLISLW